MPAQCAYCLTNKFHMVVILNSDGTYHVHAPFQNKKVMNKMIDLIKKEMKNWEKKNGQN